MSSKGSVSFPLPPPPYVQATEAAPSMPPGDPLDTREEAEEEDSLSQEIVDDLDDFRQPDLDPTVALRLIAKGKATGNRLALWIRSVIQRHFFATGKFIHRHAGKVLVAGLILLCVCCLGLRNIRFETQLAKLWIEEGGRLSDELAYMQKIHGSDTGATPLFLLQTPDKSSNTSLLSPQAFLLHLKAAMVAIEIEVEIFKATWSLRDICHKVPFPNFDETIPAISGALDMLYPCLIKSPLDCFWEGAKLLDPPNPVVIPGYDDHLTWSTFNPEKLVTTLEARTAARPKDYSILEDESDGFDSQSYGSYDTQPFTDFLKKAEIKDGYMGRVCLNPANAECPETAPNKKAMKAPNVAEVVSRGCTGLSRKNMKWNEELLFGDVKKNRLQQIYSVSAMQTMFLISSPRELYDSLKGHMKTSEDVMDTDWTEEVAAHVIQTWQAKFRSEVIKTLQNEPGKETVTVFFESNLKTIVAAFSEFSVVRLAIGFCGMVVYVCFALKKWSDPVNSYSGLGIAGTIMAGLSVAAGVSLSAFLPRIYFNMLSTQIVPFLALGLNIVYIVQMVRTLSEAVIQKVPTEDLIGECLKQNGLSTVISISAVGAAFFAGYAVPIPALRTFSLQMGILTALSCPVILLIFPAIMALDQRRRFAQRLDLFCCYGKPTVVPEVQYAKASVVTIGGPRGRNLRAVSCTAACRSGRRGPQGCVSTCRAVRGVKSQPVRLGPLDQRLVESGMLSYDGYGLRGVAGSTNSILRADPPTCCNDIQTTCETVHVSDWLVRLYLRTITSSFTKCLVLICLCIILGVSGYGMMKIEEGLDLTEFVPKGTPEHRYLDISSKGFGWYSIHAVTKGGFEYHNNQQVLHDFHQAFQRVDNVVTDKNGKLPAFWLANMRDWLYDLDAVLDKEIANGFSPRNDCRGNATSSHPNDAILACILRAQTGKDDHNLDQVSRTKLVDRRGVINPKVFYYYLSAWAGNDELAYMASQAMLHPQPKKWIFEATDRNYRVDKSQPLDSTAMHFELQGLKSAPQIIAVRNQVHLISATFEKQGLPNQPGGHIFSYWEQYDSLKFSLLASLIGLLVTFFVVISAALANLWAAAIIVLMMVLLLVEGAGLIGWIGIKLNAISVVILILSTGVGVKFCFRICMVFVMGLGCKNRRVRYSLANSLWSVVHGTVAILIGVSMLAFSGFDFVFRYFFLILSGLMLLTLLNSLVFLPVLLSFVGPVAEFISNDDPETVPTLTPEPQPCRKLQRSAYRVGASTVSLSTISEEDSLSCQQIFLEPQITVETTTSFPSVTSAATNSGPSEEKSTADSSIGSLTSTFTAKVKIEVHRSSAGSSSGSRQYVSDDCSCQE